MHNFNKEKHFWFPVILSLLTIIITTNKSTLVESCGATTHTLIGHRALNGFTYSSNPIWTQIMSTHQQAFQAGAAFPDFGYSCPLG